MLADRRAEALTTNFPDQWLALRNLEKVAPDLLGYPSWDLNLKQSAQRETELLFGASSARTAARSTSSTRTTRSERAPGGALRRAERLQVGVPPRDADRSEPPRAAGPGEHPEPDVGGHPDFAGVPRQVDPHESAELAAATAAAECPGARREQGQRGAEIGPRAARNASRESGVRVLPPQHGSIGFALENFDAVGRGTRRAKPARRSIPPAFCSTARRSTAQRHSAAG